jgi:DNA repair protein RadC
MIITREHFLPAPVTDPNHDRSIAKSNSINTIDRPIDWCTIIPGADPSPSRPDIEMTHEIINVARPLSIAAHDHIIVGRDGHASLKGLKLI